MFAQLSRAAAAEARQRGSAAEPDGEDAAQRRDPCYLSLPQAVPVALMQTRVRVRHIFCRVSLVQIRLCADHARWCPAAFSNRLGQVLISSGPSACRALGFSPRSPRWAPHVCVQGRADRSGVRGQCRCSGSDLALAARPGWTHSGVAKSASWFWLVQMTASSRKGVPVRHIACSVTASFLANATFAFRGPVRSAIALAQSRRRPPPSFRE